MNTGKHPILRHNGLLPLPLGLLVPDSPQACCVGQCPVQLLGWCFVPQKGAGGGGWTPRLWRSQQAACSALVGRGRWGCPSPTGVTVLNGSRWGRLEPGGTNCVGNNTASERGVWFPVDLALVHSKASGEGGA